MQATQFDRDRIANWYAKQHLKADPEISQIVYLGEALGEREIRFIEINELMSDSEPPDDLMPVDFGMDMGQESEHKFWVLDVSWKQFELIQNGELALPSGWNLEGSTVFTR